MKWLLWIVGGLLGVIALQQISQIIASETGEVVVVTTMAADGSTDDTRLWVVDHDGSAWLRASGETSGWYQQMLANADIEMIRNDVRAAYTIAPDTMQRDLINTLMRDKYAWRDAYISFMFSRDNVIPIRLVSQGDSHDD